MSKDGSAGGWGVYHFAEVKRGADGQKVDLRGSKKVSPQEAVMEPIESSDVEVGFKEKLDDFLRFFSGGAIMDRIGSKDYTRDPESLSGLYKEIGDKILPDLENYFGSTRPENKKIFDAYLDKQGVNTPYHGPAPKPFDGTLDWLSKPGKDSWEDIDREYLEKVADRGGVLVRDNTNQELGLLAEGLMYKIKLIIDLAIGKTDEYYGPEPKPYDASLKWHEEEWPETHKAFLEGVQSSKTGEMKESNLKSMDPVVVECGLKLKEFVDKRRNENFGKRVRER